MVWVSVFFPVLPSYWDFSHEGFGHQPAALRCADAAFWGGLAGNFTKI